eukprot:1349635-Pyramimonas_sp.AAC.1
MSTTTGTSTSSATAPPILPMTLGGAWPAKGRFSARARLAAHSGGASGTLLCQVPCKRSLVRSLFL